MEFPRGITDANRQTIVRERRVLQATGEAPLVTVTGVVSPLGGVSGWHQGDTGSRLWFWLVSWRVEGGPVSHRKLKVYKFGRKQTVESEAREIKRCSLVSMRAHVLAENEMDEPHALLIGLPSPTVDPDFDDVIRDLTTPIVVCHDRFGDFALDQHRTTFEGRIAWRGAGVRVSIDGESAEECGVGLVTLAAVVDNADWWHEWMKREIAPRVMEVLKEWEEPGFPAPSEEELLSALILEDISIYENGELQLFYDMGDCAGGHGAAARTTLAGEFRRFDLIG
ncbi:MAG: DUF2262 domain-containing protein [Phycisphaeraceae bacterium]|nr:DUF2262 domain-containing protein [Phycisphaeraceae bacterium]